MTQARKLEGVRFRPGMEDALHYAREVYPVAILPLFAFGAGFASLTSAGVEAAPT